MAQIQIKHKQVKAESNEAKRLERKRKAAEIVNEAENKNSQHQESISQISSINHKTEEKKENLFQDIVLDDSNQLTPILKKPRFSDNQEDDSEVFFQGFVYKSNYSINIYSIN